MEAKTHCAGCTNNFYNSNNNIGVTTCWLLEGAKLIQRKEVHINQAPPWTQKPRTLPDCYSKSQFVYVRADRTH
jgi:hypothetical protein